MLFVSLVAFVFVVIAAVLFVYAMRSKAGSVRMWLAFGFGIAFAATAVALMVIALR